MPDPKPVPLLGRLAVHLKMISMDQLAEAVRAQGHAGEDASSSARSSSTHGFINRGQLDQADRGAAAGDRQAEGRRRAPRRPTVAATPAPGDPRRGATRARRAGRSTGGPARRSHRPRRARTAPAPEAGPARSAARPISPRPRPPTSSASRAAAPGDRARRERRPPPRGRAAPSCASRDGSCSASEAPLDAQAAERMVLSFLDARSARRSRRAARSTPATTFPGIGRFRANVYRQQRGLDAVLPRRSRSQPPTLEELGLPARAREASRTTTRAWCSSPDRRAAASRRRWPRCVDLINEERRDHILTIEDPIEFVHTSKRCVVNQRQVGAPHRQSFARALRAALREDPDVIVIGELRDLETISLALTAAETGHLVLGDAAHRQRDPHHRTASSASFPADQQDADPHDALGVAARRGLAAAAAGAPTARGACRRSRSLVVTTRGRAT